MAYEGYDSRVDTYAHIMLVQAYLAQVIGELQNRQLRHDLTKLSEPEVSGYDRVTVKLKQVEYNSPEYKAGLLELGPALDHHYKHNDHHPEHWTYGILGMDLVVLVEMFCDWMAATKRMQKGGSIRKSIEENQKRFGYSDELKIILLNTIGVLEPGHPEGGGMMEAHELTERRRMEAEVGMVTAPEDEIEEYAVYYTRTSKLPGQHPASFSYWREHSGELDVLLTGVEELERGKKK